MTKKHRSFLKDVWIACTIFWPFINQEFREVLFVVSVWHEMIPVCRCLLCSTGYHLSFSWNFGPRCPLCGLDRHRQVLPTTRSVLAGWGTVALQIAERINWATSVKVDGFLLSAVGFSFWIVANVSITRTIFAGHWTPEISFSRSSWSLAFADLCILPLGLPVPRELNPTSEKRLQIILLTVQ